LDVRGFLSHINLPKLRIVAHVAITSGSPQEFRGHHLVDQRIARLLVQAPQSSRLRLCQR
jgi:hypothetical protein